MRTYRYAKIADDLRQQIERGDYDRTRLPSERSLMASYGVQRSTVRRALSLLGDEGRIVRASKRGSFVSRDALAARVIIGDGKQNAVIASGTVLVIAQWKETSPALEGLLRGLAKTLAQSPLSLLTFDSRPRQGRVQSEMPDADYLAAHKVRAIVLWPQSPADVAALCRLRESALLILVDRQVSGFETHSVVFDDFGGAKAVTEHLLQKGHRCIGFLADEVFAETVQQRWRGYATALESAGIAPDPTAYGLYAGMADPPFSDQMRILLNGAGRALTAMVCANDSVALHFVHFLQREGVGVPDDIAVTGFGNLLPNSMEAARLTTVRQPFDQAGQAVGRLLLSHVGAPRPPHGDAKATPYDHVQIPVELVVRASSGE